MTEETKTPGRAGRPRKQPKAEESNNGDSGGPVESTESVDSAPDEALASSESKVESANLEGAVDRLMDFMKGYTPMFNRKQRMSVVDLGSRHTGQGMKYRQLFVEETPGLLNVTIREGFKSSHGGTDQRNVLYGFSVPISEFELYGRVHRRFFGFNPKKNANEATLLLDTLEQTVRN